jgi:hypothetical protein
VQITFVTESREEEKRERKRERKQHWFNSTSVAPSLLAQLNRVVFSSTTEGHVAHDEWVVNRATAVGATESSQKAWHDWADVTPHWQRGTRLPHVSRQCTWCDSFISRTNRTGTTREGQILQISFVQVHFSKLF